MEEIFEGRGATVKAALAAMLDRLAESEALYKVQVLGGDWVVGIRAVRPSWEELHGWEDDRKVYYRRQLEGCSDLKWEDIRKGRYFYCFRDWPEKGFEAGRTYYSGVDRVISNGFGCGEMFNHVDVPFHFRFATQDETEQYFADRRRRMEEIEEYRRRLMVDDKDDDD